MKKRYITLGLFLLAAVCTIQCAVCQTAQQRLAEKVIRLHVVANSDTREDQRVKLLVRDAVLEAAGKALEGADDPQTALRENLSSIERAAENRLLRLGKKDAVRVSLQRELFPTRDYETFRLPAGVYRTLRVTIGEGAGHNWWCVVFPALCLPASEEEQRVLCEKAGLTGQEIAALCDDSGEIELEFRTLELLEKIKKKLWDA